MLRFPSVSIMFSEAYKTLQRFPLVILSAAVGAVVSVILTGADTNPEENAYPLKLLYCSLLGIPLFFSISLFTGRRGWGGIYKFLFHVGGAVALAAYYFSISETSNVLNIARFFQLNLCLHLLVAFVPFMNADEVNGFWQFNRILFLRFLTSALFSGVLFAGLALALAGLDVLFDVDVDEEIYFRLWIIIAFLFNTTFFLGGVPQNLSSLDDVTDYPKGLQIFTQYILIPLTIIYFLILYAYAAKIGIVWEWPRGWIAPLVSGLSILGIFSLLFLYPIQNRTENRWIKTYSKWFYIALFPLILLLTAAIWKRVSEYGITEKRYFLILLTVWLTGISLYFTLSKGKNIKIIPITLFLVVLLTSFGPWGAYSASEASQTGRLEALLIKNEILKEGKITKVTSGVSFEDRKKISSIVLYLVETHGTESIADWFVGGLNSTEKTEDSTKVYPEEQARKIVVEKMGLEYINSWESASTGTYFSYSSDYNDKLYEISGYDYSFLYSTGSVPIDIGGTKYEIVYSKEAESIEIKTDGEILIIVPIGHIVTEIRKLSGSNNSYSAPIEVMKAENENERVKVKIYFQHISGNEIDGKLDLSHMTADVLLRFK